MMKKIIPKSVSVLMITCIHCKDHHCRSNAAVDHAFYNCRVLSMVDCKIGVFGAFDCKIGYHFIWSQQLLQLNNEK